jgi:chemotaxis response regulator CheB
MATKRELIKEKSKLVHEIQNIKSDFRDVLAEDMPDDVNSELANLMKQLNDVRVWLAEKK